MAKRSRRSGHFGDSRRYYEWLDRANEDIMSATLLQRSDECLNNAAFHCQQTIEKALKAYILLKSNTLVDGHNLTWLCKKAMQYDSAFGEWLEGCASLSHCYIETRYPADIPLDITQDDIKLHYGTASTMYLFICKEVDSILERHASHPKQARQVFE